mgnify:FL=1|tara:strand:+ start:7503 stop:8228 length:726 start_codon:yes stop_codon:yes gene_type:complete
MPVKFNINKAYDDFFDKGGKTQFPKSLKEVLKYIQNDKNLDNIKQASYLLATAKVESDYYLERWESDYLCGKIGNAYKDTPCESALNYFRSSNGKKNYYSLGVDEKGLPYFGRGLIQLSGKENYIIYGDLIGVNLEDNGDKALVPKNSYKIASEYLLRKTFTFIDSDLTKARKSVNGGTKGLSEVNAEYNLWVSILKEPEVKFKETNTTKSERVGSVLLYTTLFLAVLGFSIGLSLATRNR